MSKETIESEFSVTAPVSVRVVNIRGLVDVQPAADGVVSITAVKHTESGDAEQTVVEIEQEEDGRIVARTRFRESEKQGRACKVDYAIQVPQGCELSIDCVSSKMSVSGLRGTFDFNTVSGDIVLKDLSGEAEVNSVSGDITGARLSGPMTLKSVSGDVDLADTHLSTFLSTSVSGNLLFDGTLDQGPYRLKTISGNVRITLPPESGCSFDIASLSGDFRSALPVTQTQQQRWKMRADVQGGGPEVFFSSISGNLLVG